MDELPLFSRVANRGGFVDDGASAELRVNSFARTHNVQHLDVMS